MFVLWLSTAVALATDTWTVVRDGVTYLHRVDPEPWDIHAVRVDLADPRVGLHASSDAIGTERGVVGSTFAQNADALVSINGDWSDGVTPVGLAMSDGWMWHGHYDDPNIGGTWSYIACDAFNACTIEALPPLSQVWWFNPSLPPYRYINAVGANGLLLLDNGVRLSGCYDGCTGDSCRNPRSAVCLEQDGQHLWFIAVDGRQADSAGMTCGEMRDLVEDLGCWDAAMLDGGGSTTLWVDGAVVNDPSDGRERTVANHLAIRYTDPAEPACTLTEGAWCDGTVRSVCTGGRQIGSFDCAFFGASCQEDGDWAFCVDSRCPGGDGTASVCLDATRVAGCTDGQYGEGDCGVFGLTCGTDAAGSACQDPRCIEGPHSSFCAATETLATCTDGAYAESTCDDGTHCDDAGDLCVDDRCDAADALACVGDLWAGCTAGVYAETDCAASGETCAPGVGCVAVGGTTDDTTDPGSDDDTTGDDAEWTGGGYRIDGGEDGGCGCAAVGRSGRWSWPSGGLLAILLLVPARRLRR